jgi:hypothetical protein
MSYNYSPLKTIVVEKPENQGLPVYRPPIPQGNKSPQSQSVWKKEAPPKQLETSSLEDFLGEPVNLEK